MRDAQVSRKEMRCQLPDEIIGTEGVGTAMLSQAGSHTVLLRRIPPQRLAMYTSGESNRALSSQETSWCPRMLRKKKLFNSWRDIVPAFTTCVSTGNA